MSAKSEKGEKTPVPTAFSFLESNCPTPLPAFAILFGSDDFLRHQSLKHLVSGSGLDESSIQSFDGDDAQWRDVHDQLATQSLFDELGGRLAIVRGADRFVTKFRDSIERWINSKPTGCTLVLELNSLASNTKLYQSASKTGLLVKCTPPQKSSWGNPLDEESMKKWVVKWGEQKHSIKLTAAQSALIVERIGAWCGLIDSELAKLALFAESNGKVSEARVTELVGGWRTQTAWEVADAIADGKAEVALEQFDKLLLSGQNTVGLAAQISWSLRRLGIAAQLVEISERKGEKLNLAGALERAGFNRYDISKAETRLRRIGRQRAKQLLNDLVDLELKLKGSHSNEHRARFAFERFIFSLR